MTPSLKTFPGIEPATWAGDMSRMAAAYRLRLAKRAQGMGAEAPHWDGMSISIDEQEKLLLAEDLHRIEPYPFPGLRSFEPGEGEIFFGRNRNVEAVRDLLAKNRVVAVLGGSGSGKSSLLRAGLLPFLNTNRRIQGRVGNWYSLDFRPRTQPLRELASAFSEQLMLPLQRMSEAVGTPASPQQTGLATELDLNSDGAASRLGEHFHDRFIKATQKGRDAVFSTFIDLAEGMLDKADKFVTGGRRLGEPSLFLLVDQLEEVFRPEVARDQREALLNLIVDLHAAARERKGGVYLALSMRSEELHRCAEHRGLSDVVIGSGYQLELLDPADRDDRADLRLAIVQPARNVFEDWGLRGWLKLKDDDAIRCHRDKDAPFSEGMPDLLLAAANRLSKELEHRPDQLPLLQHALQATWHSAMKRWSLGVSCLEELQIMRDDLPGYHNDEEVPDLGECLNLRADAACTEAAKRFARAAANAGATEETGEDALRAAFRALARRDDLGNWARRFADPNDIKVFLDAEADSVLARIRDAPRWIALQKALNSFLLRGYLNGGGIRDYDISHEALIRNWRKFQVWLRDPREVAYSLGRVLREVEEPDKFAQLSDHAKDALIPQAVASRVAMVAAEGQLPTRWGEDQIAPVLQNLPTRRRWGKSSEALAKVIALGKMADRARDRIRTKRFFEKRAKFIFGALFLSALVALGGSLYYSHLQSVVDANAQEVERKKAEMRRITALARDALWSDGPATAILMASRVQKVDLPEAPEAERLLLTSLHLLREERILAKGHDQMVNGVSYSPDGSVIVSSDPTNLVFTNAKDGTPLDKIELSYLPIKRTGFEGPFFGSQWSPGQDWISVYSRDQTLLIAPCSRRELKPEFVTCEGRDEDVVQVLGKSQDRAGAAKFSGDGKFVTTGGFGAAVKLWDVGEVPARKLREFEGTISWPNAFAISSDARTVALGLGQSQGEIRLLDASSGDLVGRLDVGKGQHGSFVAIAFNPSEPRMLAASSSDGNIFVWEDWTDPDKALLPIKLENARGTAFQMSFSRDGGYLIAASDDGVLRMWATKDGEADSRWRQLGELRGHKGPVWAVAFSPDGNHIASGSTDGSMLTWSRSSAFHLGEAHGTSALPHTSTREDLNSCVKGLVLPRDFGDLAGCVRSPNGRVVVASSKGRLEVFDSEQDAFIRSRRLPTSVRHRGARTCRRQTHR